MTKSTEREDWEAHDAMHTLMRAEDVKKDKGLMKRVQKKAAEHAERSRDVAERAGRLAKMGRISEKQMAKMSGGNGSAKAETKNLDKTTPIA